MLLTLNKSEIAHPDAVGVPLVSEFKTKRRGESGFTLIDIMVAMIVMGVLMAVVVGGMGQIMKTKNIEAHTAMGNSFEQWAVKNPTLAIESTNGYVSYESYKSEAQSRGLLLPELGNQDSQNIKVVTNSLAGSDYTICVYEEPYRSKSNSNRKYNATVYSYDSVQAKATTDKNVACN